MEGEAFTRLTLLSSAEALAAMVAQLTSAGIAVEVDKDVYPNGRFARLEDPDGIPFSYGSRSPAPLRRNLGSELAMTR